MQWLEPVAVASIGGLFGLVPVISQAVANRSRERKQASRIAHVKDELECIEKFAAVGGAAPLDEAGQARFDHFMADAVLRLSERYDALTARIKNGQFASRVPPLSEIGWPRRLLLAFRPLSTSGWVVHTLFYACCFMALTMVVNEAVQPTIDDETNKPFGWGTMLLGIAVVFGVPAFALFVSAVNLYSRAVRARRSEESSSSSVA